MGDEIGDDTDDSMDDAMGECGNGKADGPGVCKYDTEREVPKRGNKLLQKTYFRELSLVPLLRVDEMQRGVGGSLELDGFWMGCSGRMRKQRRKAVMAAGAELPCVPASPASTEVPTTPPSASARALFW